MISKNKIGRITIAIMTIALVLVTIRLSGHKHSLGIFVLALFGFYFVAFLSGAILKATEVISKPLFYVFVAVLFTSFSLFFVYHHSYDSHNETRSLLCGFNGE
ncbi:hypothetical protein [Flavobacterium microcysteis]